MSVLTAMAFDIMSPGIGPSLVQIVQIALVGVSLALKRYIAISIATHGQSHEPLHQIGHVEEYKKHLSLLCRVDAFMVHQLMAQIHPRVHKKQSQQVDGRESSKGQYGGADYFHACKGTIFF